MNTTIHSPIFNNYVNKANSLKRQAPLSESQLQTKPDSFKRENKNENNNQNDFSKKLKIAGYVLAALLVVGLVANYFKTRSSTGKNPAVLPQKTPPEINPQETPPIVHPKGGTNSNRNVSIYQAFVTDKNYELAKEIFKNETGAVLHCPTPTDDFINGLCNLCVLARDGNFPKDIKHVVIGHGIGSSLRDNWRFVGSGQNVFDYIEKNIPKGEDVLVLVCEETVDKVAGKPAIGSKANMSLTQEDRPLKIVRSGERKIIGQFLNPLRSNYPTGTHVGLYYYED